MNGAFVISLDYELYWGIRDTLPLSSYGKRLLNVKKAIPAILNTFEQFGIHATWATVGILFARDKPHLLEHAPVLAPGYTETKYNPYLEFNDMGHDEESDPIRYGHSMIQQIREYKNQEIASHTFSHYYCLEKGQSHEAFNADLTSAISIAKEEGFEIKSIVFPKNQYGPEYLDICTRHGITVFRGNEKTWSYQPSTEANHRGKLRRLFRLADAYINLTGHHTYSWDSIEKKVPYNVPSSRLLRPFIPVLSFAEPLRLHRIISGMTLAARKNEIFHLWWHPHNFGGELDQNISFLKKVLEHYLTLNENYQMESLNLRDVADRLEA